MKNILHEMEERFHCRYELGGEGSGQLAFPVTHVLEAERVAAGSGRVMRYANISLCNEELSWCILDARGVQMIHGIEQNLEGTRGGYIAMIRRALLRLQPYGARRVHPRITAHRQPARAAEHWSLQG